MIGQCLSNKNESAKKGLSHARYTPSSRGPPGVHRVCRNLRISAGTAGCLRWCARRAAANGAGRVGPASPPPYVASLQPRASTKNSEHSAAGSRGLWAKPCAAFQFQRELAAGGRALPHKTVVPRRGVRPCVKTRNDTRCCMCVYDTRACLFTAANRLAVPSRFAALAGAPCVRFTEFQACRRWDVDRRGHEDMFVFHPDYSSCMVSAKGRTTTNNLGTRCVMSATAATGERGPLLVQTKVQGGTCLSALPIPASNQDWKLCNIYIYILCN